MAPGPQQADLEAADSVGYMGDKGWQYGGAAQSQGWEWWGILRMLVRALRPLRGRWLQLVGWAVSIPLQWLLHAQACVAVGTVCQAGTKEAGDCIFPLSLQLPHIPVAGPGWK